MENKEKEYLGIVIITLLHGIYTYIDLGGMPYIAFGILSRITVGAFVMWVIYGMVLYLITVMWIIQANTTVKHCVLAVVFGGMTAIIKGSIDWIMGKLQIFSNSVITIAYTDQITTILFGILLMVVLLIVVAKRKIHFDIKRIKVPMCILIITVMSYVAFVLNYLHQNQIGIQRYNATEEQISNLDYHFGMKILAGNVWFYIIFYITFWWFMRRLTEETEEE